MVSFFLTLFFGLFALIAISLQRTYAVVPVKELRRRARAGDEFADVLYRAVGYGHSLRVFLWVLVGITWSIYFVYVANVWPDFTAFVLSVILLVGGLVYTPSGKVNALGGRLAALISPTIAWLLNYLHTPIDAMVQFTRRHRPVHMHTGLYEREDLVELLERQQVQADNRIVEEELRIALHALTFGQLIIRDVMTPRRMVKMVQADETVGPLLMTELHKSGHSRFPVYDGAKDNVVGMLYLRELTKAKAGGHVKAIMRSGDVCYVREDKPLTEVLQAVFKTRQHLMIVVNSFEEFVGIITVEDVLEQIVGRPIMDEFDQYEDIRAVAAREAADERAARSQDQQDSQPATEVIE